MPEFSVVIPTHNRRHLLELAVASVRAQGVRDCEVCVVDDGSEDDTSEWLDAVGDRSLRHFRNETAQRESAARNLGFENTDSEFVLFLDDDDQLAPGALAGLARGLRSSGNAIAAAGAYRQLLGGRVGRRHQTHPRRRVEATIWREELFDWNLPPGAVLWRRKAFAAKGRWNEAISDGEDRELNLRTYPDRLVLVPQEVLHYRVHPGQATARTTVGDELREVFAEGLEGSERRQATRILEARPAFREALRLYGDGAYRESLIGLRDILRGTGLARSPILAPWLIGLFLKAVGGAALPERATAEIRRRRRRQSGRLS